MDLRRSVLTTPGSDRAKLNTAAASAADQVMIDLEDGVSDTQKSTARTTAVEAIRSCDWTGTRLALRINGMNTEYAYKDLVHVIEAVGGAIDSVVVPKVIDAFEVAAVGNLLGQIERSEGLDRIALEPLIEGVQAIQTVDEIAAASGRVDALVFGPGDYAASQRMRTTDLGGVSDSRPYPGDMWHYARHRIAIAARANDAVPLDGSYPEFEDLNGFRQECRQARTLGFAGKWAVHPDQVAPANEMFTPTQAEIREAQKILDAVTEAADAGRGAVGLDGVVQDGATARMARRVLERARATGQIE